MEQAIGIAVVVAFYLAFPAIWIMVSLLLSHIGDWTALARRYRSEAPVEGPTFHMCSGYVGSVCYRSCLVLRMCETGLQLSVLFPFRLGHPPLFIPWDEFHGMPKTGTSSSRFLDVCVGRPAVGTVSLPIWIREYMPSKVHAG